uniref:SHSP domain-containing protein n=1 Tax=Tanacetum cinerariifolium TaxID=118510 RepID=A0A6L2JBF0_TANCI|nr:hypothetical protein [Tanacetum cinerariifolium]
MAQSQMTLPVFLQRIPTLKSNPSALISIPNTHKKNHKLNIVKAEVGNGDYLQRSNIKNQQQKQPIKKRVVQSPPIGLWDGFPTARTVQQMMDTMERLMEEPQASSTYQWGPQGDTTSSYSRGRTPWEIKESENEYKIRFDMPGMTREDVKVWVEEKMLVLKAEKAMKDDNNNNGDGNVDEGEWSPKSYGKYSFRIALPENIQFEKIKAEVKDGTSAQDHLDEFNNILIDLKNLDVNVYDEDKAVLLVIFLPAFYKHFKEIMLYGNRETLSFDDVKSALLSKQSMIMMWSQKVVKGWLQEAEVLTEVRVAIKIKNIDHNLMENIQIRVAIYSNKSCKYCNKLGHTVSDCYKLKNKLKREGKRKNNEKKPEKAAEVAIAKGDFDVYLAIDNEKSRDELIVESDYTFHMIPHQSWFTTYESFNGGNVYMKNHSICLVIGKGNIQVKMHDDYSGGGGVMKIFKGALVLMKAIQSGYRVWCPDLKYRKIIHSRDVTFNEDVIINFGKDFVPPHNVDNNHTEGKVEFEFDVKNSTHTQPPFNDEHIETQNDDNMPTSPQSQPQTEYLLAWDRKRRQVNRPLILEDYQCDLVAYAFAVAAHIKNCEPTNYLEAISSLECDKWVVTMEEEVESLHKNEM